MKVIRKPQEKHECDIESPMAHDVGTIVECDRCHRRWKMARYGWSFKSWRLTCRSLLFHGPAKQPWGPVDRGNT